ncbi:MAG: hypothetical protein ACLTGM_12110 [Oscillospiraceae bacterium]
MAKRDKDMVTLKSGKIYLQTFSESMPTVDALRGKQSARLYRRRVAGIYPGDHEEKDLGYVSKITTNEEAVLKCGLLTWNGTTLKKLLDRCSSTEASGKRTTKIGGAGNAQGGYYAICFHHEDKTDGDLWILIKGRNAAGATLTFATDAGTTVEPEFKALPHDSDGTLVELIEEIPTA